MRSFQSDLFEHLIITGLKFNSCHNTSDGRFCSGGGGRGAMVAPAPDTQYPDIKKESPDGQAYRALRMPVGSGDATYAEVVATKEAIATNLSEKSGLDYQEVNQAIYHWAETSNDSHYGSLTMQQSAGELFGVEMSDWQKKQLAEVESWGASRDSVGGSPWKSVHDEVANKRFLETMYNETQKDFASQGITHVTLYRGANLTSDATHKYRLGTTVNLESNVLESWSADPKIASSFGMTVFKTTVPVDRILSTAKTGFGCLNEKEFVVIGGKGDTALIVK